jgi:hypothetical protein
MTSKGSIGGQLDRQIAAGNLLAVRGLADELPQLSLERAARITLLILEAEPESYEAAARRLISRIARERAIPLTQLADLTLTLSQLQINPAAGDRSELLRTISAAPRQRPS